MVYHLVFKNTMKNYLYTILAIIFFVSCSSPMDLDTDREDTFVPGPDNTVIPKVEVSCEEIYIISGDGEDSGQISRKVNLEYVEQGAYVDLKTDPDKFFIKSKWVRGETANTPDIPVSIMTLDFSLYGIDLENNFFYIYEPADSANGISVGVEFRDVYDIRHGSTKLYVAESESQTTNNSYLLTMEMKNLSYTDSYQRDIGWQIVVKIKISY